MSDYYDRDGQTMTLEQWAIRYQDRDYKIVAFTEREGVRVSTVWLGLNHQWDPDKAPLIFETMVFGGELDENQWRWTTEEEALAGHAEICSGALR